MSAKDLVAAAKSVGDSIVILHACSPSIQVYVLRKGPLGPYIPILFGWDWNPKNP